MQLQIIRSKVSSPDWLNQLSQKYRRDQKERELRKIEDTQKQRVELVKEVVKEIGKEDPKVTTAEIEKPTPTPTENKVDAKAILDVIREIGETLETHAKIIDDLSDRVETLEQGQTRKTDGRSAITHSQPSQLDLEIIQSRFEAVGLTGEVRKEIHNPYIQGRFND